MRYTSTQCACPNGVSVKVLSKSTTWFRRQTADKAHFYGFYNVVILKIRTRSPKSNHFLLIIQIILYIMFGQNLSFGSRVRVQKSFLGQNLTFKVLV